MIRFSCSADLRLCCVWLVLTAIAATAHQTNDIERPLSLSECFRIALEHNLDIEIARLNPSIQRHNLSASYGAYEPTFSFDGQRGFSTVPVGVNELDQPVAGPTSYGDSFTPGLSGILPTGLGYEFGGNLTGISETIPSGATREANAAASVQLNQPLLRNAWIDGARETILVNKKLLKISQWAVTQQIMATLTSVEQAYYNLIVAREQAKVYEQALQLAQRLVDESKLRVKAGSQAALDEKQAESQLASSRSALIGVQGALLAQEYTLKNLMTDNLSDWEGVHIKPTEKLLVVARPFNLYSSWSRALSQRPDLLEARANIERQGIVLKYLRNQIYPSLDVFGSYAFTGAGTTYADALGGVQRGNSPSWSVGVQLSLPIEGNRTALENYRSNKAQKEQLLLQLKQQEQSVMVQIAVSMEQAQTRFAQVDATHQSTVFAEAALNAEQEKLENGKSTSFVMVQLQRDLTTARLAELAAISQYNQALAQLALNEGSTLERDHLGLEFR